MISIIYKKSKSLEKLLFFGGISFSICDMKERNLKNI